MANVGKNIFWLLLALSSTFLIFNTSEQCMAKGDKRKALEMVSFKKAHTNAQTIPEFLNSIYPQQSSSAVWVADVLDRVHGRVNVRVVIPHAKQTPTPIDISYEKNGSVHFVFLVSLSANQMAPENENAKNLVAHLEKN